MGRRMVARVGACLAAGCDAPAEPDAPVQLCSAHLLAAHDWVGRTVGVTDVLPSPCAACGSRLGVRYPSGWLCAVCEWRAGDIPDGELAPVRVDVVYYLGFGDRIKIGTSSNPRSRLAQLRFDELLAFERGDRAIEQRRHAQFANLRYPGSEWFSSSPQLREHIRSLSDGVADPWNLHRRWLSERLALRT